MGDFNATDADAWDVLTFSLVPGAVDNNLFFIDSNGTITTATTFDYETMNANMSVRVLVTDEKNASITADFPVTLNDMDDRPALVSNGVLTKINESMAVIHPKVDQIGVAYITPQEQ